jgi:glycerophosphoryl diester phosphodiesterase
MADRPLLAVAHRAGNNLADLRAALAADVDLVEADVHLYRGALEVRHLKAIGPYVYWEPWREVRRRRDLVVPDLHDLLAAADGDPRLMLDLKGRSPAVASHVAEMLRTDWPAMSIAVCTKRWQMLDAFAGDPQVRRIFSAGNAKQLSRLRARVRGERVDGMSIRLSLLTAPVVAELRRSTDLILAWSVDSEAGLARAENLGVTGVISKEMPILNGLIARRGTAASAWLG